MQRCTYTGAFELKLSQPLHLDFLSYSGRQARDRLLTLFLKFLITLGSERSVTFCILSRSLLQGGTE